MIRARLTDRIVQVVAVLWFFEPQFDEDLADYLDLVSDSVNSIVAFAWRSWNNDENNVSARRSWQRVRNAGLGPGSSGGCSCGCRGGRGRGSGEGKGI